MSDLAAFIQEWNDNSGSKELFTAIKNLAGELGLSSEYVGRPGVSHSLRLGWPGAERPFFAMADVIDDAPEARWLSICMYADVAVDPEERGDLVPKGLNNQDALCFDMDEPEDDDKKYVLEMLRQAAKKAKALFNA